MSIRRSIVRWKQACDGSPVAIFDKPKILVFGFILEPLQTIESVIDDGEFFQDEITREHGFVGMHFNGRSRGEQWLLRASNEATT